MTEVLFYQSADAPFNLLTQDQRVPEEETGPVVAGLTGPRVAVTGAEATLAETALFDAQDHVSTERVEGLPLSLVRAYARRAEGHSWLREADPGVWVATVAGLDGVYGDGPSEDAAREDLRSSVVGWVAVMRRLSLKIPVLDGLDLNLPPHPDPS